MRIFLLGTLAWLAVAALAILMAEIDEPVLGFFPILAAVFAVWVGGELVAHVLTRESEHD